MTLLFPRALVGAVSLCAAAGAALAQPSGDNPSGSDSLPDGTFRLGPVVEDSRVTLLLRNYADDLETDDASRHAWVQSARLAWQSGFTHGAVGWGIDAALFGAVKLDGSDGAGNMVHVDRDGGGQERVAWVWLGAWALKAQAAGWIAKYGLQTVSNPFLEPYDNRALPPTFRGFVASGPVVPGLELETGSFDAVNARGSTVLRSLSSAYGLIGFDRMTYAGGRWKASPDFESTLYASRASGLWDEVYLALAGGTGQAADLRWSGRADAYVMRSVKDGGEGRLDTVGTSATISAQHGASTVSLSYQQIFGDQYLDFCRETSGLYLANSVGSDFNAPGERSLQLRYTLRQSLLDKGEVKISLWGVQGWGTDASAGAKTWAAPDSLLHSLYWKNGRPVSGREHEFGLSTSYRLLGGTMRDTRFQLSLIAHTNTRYYLGDSYREVVFTINSALGLR